MTSDPTTLILMPVYNDWEAVALLLPRLEAALVDGGFHADVLLVDDGSTTAPPAAALAPPGRCIRSVSILVLRENLGHQRAIAVGLTHAAIHLKPDRVVVMDSDGEDSPSDAARLVEVSSRRSEPCIVFAERAGRSEGAVFRLGYGAYRLLFRVLTGRRINFGNFSVVPGALLSRLTGSSDLWNHYAAAVIHSGLPFDAIPTVRGRRLAGAAKVNLRGLVTHGLSAISVFRERFGRRLLALSVFFLAALAGVAFAGPRVAPLDVARTAAACAALGVTWIVVAAWLFVVLRKLSARSDAGVVPSRDAEAYVRP
jgi:glycosyltransferase involved in cell wall biosynthesis